MAAAALGLLLGLLRVVATALGNVQEILAATIDVTRQAADDYENSQLGALTVPSGGQLLGQVHSEVLSPALERAATKSFGFLARPLVWFYRRTIGTAMRQVVKRLDASPRAAEYQQKLQRVADTTLSDTTYTDAIQSYTAAASETVERLGMRIRFYAMLPMQVLFAGAVLLACLPIGIWMYLSW